METREEGLDEDDEEKSDNHDQLKASRYPSAREILSSSWHILFVYVFTYCSDGIGISIVGPSLLQLGRQVRGPKCIFSLVCVNVAENKFYFIHY